MDPISNFKSFVICTAKGWSSAMLIRFFSETFSCMPLVFVFFNSPKYIWPNSLKILVNCVFSLTRIFLQPFSILSTVYVLYIHGFFFYQFNFIFKDSLVTNNHDVGCITPRIDWRDKTNFSISLPRPPTLSLVCKCMQFRWLHR